MTFERLAAMNRYWEHHPPTHIMIASYFGITKKTDPVNDIGQLMQDCAAMSGRQ